jgi:hypothetical protein
MAQAPTIRNAVVAPLAMLAWFLLLLPGVSRLFWLPGALPALCAAIAALTYLGLRGVPLLRASVAFVCALPFAAFWYFQMLPPSEAANRPLGEVFLLMLSAGALLGAVLPLAVAMVGRMKPNPTPHADARDVPASAGGSGVRAGGRER